jgi:DNA-binding transcriptional LysR family regulator
MEIWQLNTFKVVAKTLHFTHASQELNLTQSAVSHQIKSLEEELGVRLFSREKRKISLTSQGNRLLDYANQILNQVDLMRQEIKENNDVLNGQIILSTVTQGLGNPFPLHYEKFKKKYPDLDLVFKSERAITDLVENVKTGSIDVGLVPDGLDLNGLETILYGEYNLLFVVGVNHRLANKKGVEISDLQNEDWVMFEIGSKLRLIFDTYLANAGIIPKSIYESNDGSLVRTMAAQTNRISLLPEWGIFEELQSGKLLAIKVKGLEKKIQVNIIWKESRRTKTMTAVLNYVLQEKLEGIKLAIEK